MRTREGSIKYRQKKSLKEKQRARRRNQIKHWAKLNNARELLKALKKQDVDNFVNSLKEKAKEKILP